MTRVAAEGSLQAATNSQSARRDHAEGPGDFSTAVFQDGGYDIGLVGRVETRQPDKNNSGVDQLLPKNEFAEIFILSQEQSLSLIRLSQNGRVIYSRVDLGNVKERVAFPPEPIDERLIDVLVGNKIHAAAPAIG